MTDYRKILPNAPESFWKRNPHLVPLAPELRPKITEPDERGKGEDRSLAEVAGGPHFRVTFTTYRKRLLDEHDNARHALKPLADQITAALGFKSDDCEGLQWCYHQIKSKTSGTHILIEQL